MFLADSDKAYTGNYPTLVDLKLAYGPMAPTKWIAIQLQQVNEFFGSSIPMEANQILQIATLIAAKYYYYKTSEIMLFFTRFQMMMYGEIYGSLKPSDILSAFNKFRQERASEMDKIEDAEAKRKEDIGSVEWKAVVNKIQSEAIRNALLNAWVYSYKDGVVTLVFAESKLGKESKAEWHRLTPDRRKVITDELEKELGRAVTEIRVL